MSATQIALIIVGILLVGLAIFVGITQVGENPVRANEEAVTRDCYQIVARAELWYERPTEVGGGGQSFEGLTLDGLRLEASTDNGSYEFENISDKAFQIVGTGLEDGDGDGEPFKIRLTYDAFTDSTTWEKMGS